MGHCDRLQLGAPTWELDNPTYRGVCSCSSGSGFFLVSPKRLWQGTAGEYCLMSPRHLTFECGVGTVTTAYGDAPGSESPRFLLLLSVLLLSAASRSFRHLHLDQEGGLIISEHTRHVYE